MTNLCSELCRYFNDFNRNRLDKKRNGQLINKSDIYYLTKTLYERIVGR